MTRVTFFAVVTLLMAAVPATARAQLPIPSFGIVAGASHYSFSQSGTAPFAALRIDVPILVVTGEGSLGVFRANERTGTTTYLIPEAQLQWEMFPVIVHPYIGVGGGVMRGLSGPGELGGDFTASGSAGVRVAVPIIGAGFRAEVRFRCVNGCSNHATELTAGIHL